MITCGRKGKGVMLYFHTDDYIEALRETLR